MYIINLTLIFVFMYISLIFVDIPGCFLCAYVHLASCFTVTLKSASIYNAQLKACSSTRVSSRWVMNEEKATKAVGRCFLTGFFSSALNSF